VVPDALRQCLGDGDQPLPQHAVAIILPLQHRHHCSAPAPASSGRDRHVEIAGAVRVNSARRVDLGERARSKASAAAERDLHALAQLFGVATSIRGRSRLSNTGSAASANDSMR